MRKFHILFVLSVVFLFFSCTNEIEFSGDQQQPMMVLNSFLTPDSVVKVQLTRSKFFLEDDTKFEVITNADVKLFVNGSFVEKLNHTSNGYYSGSYFPKENDIVKFIAYAPQLSEVNASTIIAPKQLITGIDSSSILLGVNPIFEYNYVGPNYNPIYDTIGYSYNKGLDLHIRFKDQANLNNYYRLVLKSRMYYSNGEIMEGPVGASFDDLVFGNNNTDILGESSSYYSFNEFNDQLFDGKTYELKMRVFYSYSKLHEGASLTTSPQVDVNTPIKRELVVELQSISESYYHYLKSVSANEGADMFFSEPVQIYSNIENGIGILGSYTRSSKVFELPQTAYFNDFYYGSGY